MGEVVVDTKFLRRYAIQLEHITDGPRRSLKEYIGEHYSRKAGMVDWLLPFQLVADDLEHRARLRLSETSFGLASASWALEHAADSYDREDYDSARRIIAVASDHLPEGYKESDLTAADAGSFPDKPRIELSPPKVVKKAPPYRKKFHKDLDDLSPWVESIYGYSVLDISLRLVRPEWGTLDTVGSAYRQASKWYTAVAEDVQNGMDILSSHWTDGEASMAFDHFIRQRWTKHLETRSVFERMAGEGYEYCSAFADVVIEFVAGVIHNWAECVTNLRRAMEHMSALDFWETAKDVLHAVVALIKFVRTVTKTLDGLSEFADIAIDLAVDEAHVATNLQLGHHRVPRLDDRPQE